MGRSVNKIILVGNVGREPDVRQTQSGSKVAHISLATNRWIPGGDDDAVLVGHDWGAPAAYAAVHAANMRKAGAPRRADGKQLRPPDWRPADLMAVVARQRTTADQGRHVEALTEAEGGPERR